MSTLIKRSFVGGEIAPAVQARADTSKFEYGLKTCRNFLVMRHGGVQNRPGTKLVGEIFPVDFPTTYGKAIRLVPFIVDSSNAYVLEFRSLTPSNASMRVIKNGAYVATSVSFIASVTKASPAVVTTTAAHGLITGQEVFINNCIGMEELNYRDLIITVLSPTTFSLQNQNGTPFDSTTFADYLTSSTLFAGTVSAIYQTVATGITITPATESGLKYVQTANSMIFVGRRDPVNPVAQSPVELKRITDTNWTFTTMTFAPTQAPATALIATANAGAGGIIFRYVVAAINSTTGEESLPTAVSATAACAQPNGTAPAFSNKLDWTAASGASEYNIYKETAPGTGFYGLIGIANGVHFEDIGQVVGSKEPVKANDPFGVALTGKPTCVAFFQQRLLFGNSEDFSERIWGSRSGLKNNFGISRQLQDDDSLQFDMTANQLNKIVNMINIGKLVVLTSGSENSIEGDASGVITPTAINPKQYSQNGSSIVPPLVVGGNALYIQNRGAIVRDLAFEFQSDSYRGNDLTIYSSHLFEGRTIVEWAWQQIPQSIVWCVLDNGTVIALTYVREQQIWAWHRHDTDGLVKHICSIPEQGEDFIYAVVQRTIGGVARFFTERLNTRIVNDPQASDSVFSDCGISFGRPYGSLQTVPLEILNNISIVNSAPPFNLVVVNNPTWLAGVPLGVRINGFAPGPPIGTYKVGDTFRVTSANGTIITLTITVVGPSAYFVVVADKNIPSDLQAGAVIPPIFNETYNWVAPKLSFTGLWHLEGKSVSVLADGAVVASPNNSAYGAPLVVTNGKITIPNPANLVTVGLPYISDLETLNIDSPQGETAIDKAKSVGRVTVALEESRGGFYGPEVPTGSDALKGMYELKTRDQELYGSNVELLTGYADVNLQTEWNSNGRILIRQTEPLPLSVLAVAAGGFFPLRP